MSQHAPALAAVILATILGGGAVVAAAPSPGADRPNVEVAVSSGGRCGKFADTLPPLVLENDVRAGDSTAAVVVCVANRGKASGRVSLLASGLIETDPACTGDEPRVDGSCGVGAGEAGSAMIQHVAVDPACKRNRPPTEGQLQVGPLEGLDDAHVNLSTTLRPDQVLCVRLWLVASNEPTISTAAQSDAVTWRYDFVLETL